MLFEDHADKQLHKSNACLHCMLLLLQAFQVRIAIGTATPFSSKPPRSQSFGKKEAAKAAKTSSADAAGPYVQITAAPTVDRDVSGDAASADFIRLLKEKVGGLPQAFSK